MLCTLYLDNADCDGWVMSVVWRMVAFQKTSYIYGELALKRRTTGRPHLRYKDVCVRDMKAVDIDTMSWEGLAADRMKWGSALKQHIKTGEYKLMAAAADKRARRKEGSSSIQPETIHRCDVCNKDCHSNIGLFSHLSDAATTQPEINKIKNKNITMYHRLID